MYDSPPHPALRGQEAEVYCYVGLLATRYDGEGHPAACVSEERWRSRVARPTYYQCSKGLAKLVHLDPVSLLQRVPLCHRLATRADDLGLGLSVWPARPSGHRVLRNCLT